MMGASLAMARPPSDVATDAQAALLEACARGDREAFASLFEAWKGRVYSLALHLSGEPAEAADVTQEVFLKLLTRVGQFRADARFSTWLHRVTVNTHLDRRRARRRFVALEPGDRAFAAAASQEGALERAETRRVVALAVARLGPKLRVPLVLRYVSDLSYDEIAAVLGVSVGTVGSRLSRALSALGRELGALGERP